MILNILEYIGVIYAALLFLVALNDCKVNMFKKKKSASKPLTPPVQQPPKVLCELSNYRFVRVQVPRYYIAPNKFGELCSEIYVYEDSIVTESRVFDAMGAMSWVEDTRLEMLDYNDPSKFKVICKEFLTRVEGLTSELMEQKQINNELLLALSSQNLVNKK